MRVLFVCIENSCRSQMAEAFARMIGGPDVEAYSAGSKPSRQVNPRAVEYMAERGYDLATHRSNGLGDVPQDGYDFAVTMGCGDACPMIPARHHVDWDLPDPKELPPDEFRAIRDEIERRVRDLLSTRST